MEFLISLNNKGSIRPRLVGGKGASLQKLIRLGHNVPDGFVLTTRAFIEFIATNGLVEQIKIELRQIKSKESRGPASTTIQSMIVGASIPDTIINEAEVGLRQLRGRRFAVRSSASVEDSRKHSWAGQFDSFLDIGRREITKYIKKCWASFFNSRAFNYQPEAYKKLEDLGIAVVVQEMIPSDFAGVVFSNDPTDRRAHRMLVEAVVGHADGLVSGRKQSFSATLDKQDGRVISSSYPHQNGDWPAPSTFQLRLIYQQAIRVEQEFKQPVDIEWAFAKNQLFLLQARPITAFSGGLK